MTSGQVKDVFWSRDSRAVQWLTIVYVLSLSSLLFAGLIEWDRYLVICDSQGDVIMRKPHQ